VPITDSPSANSSNRQLLREAVAAAKAGNKDVAREMVREALDGDPFNEQLRLLAASLSRTVEEAVPHVEQVLLINPRNEKALAWMERVRKGGAPKPGLKKTVDSAASAEASAAAVSAKTGPAAPIAATPPAVPLDRPSPASPKANVEEERHLTVVERLLAARGSPRPLGPDGAPLGPAGEHFPSAPPAADERGGMERPVFATTEGGRSVGLRMDAEPRNDTGLRPETALRGDTGPGSAIELRGATTEGRETTESMRIGEAPTAAPPLTPTEALILAARPSTTRSALPAPLAASRVVPDPGIVRPGISEESQSPLSTAGAELAGRGAMHFVDPELAPAGRNGAGGRTPAPDAAWKCLFCEQPAGAEPRRCPHCHAAVHLAVADMITRQENVDEPALRRALDRWRSALEKEPNAAAHVALALAHLNLNESAQALVHLRQACGLRSNDHELQEAFHAIKRRKLVVIAEEDETLRNALTELLENHRLRTRPAANGFQALSLVEDEMPDLILASSSMPRMGGYELCKVVRRNASTKGTPLVLLVEKAGLIERARGRAAGATDYMSKPVDGNALLRLLKALLPDSMLPDPKMTSRTMLRI
jgi:twitching motility two-component system response regulator PilG